MKLIYQSVLFIFFFFSLNSVLAESIAELNDPNGPLQLIKYQIDKDTLSAGDTVRVALDLKLPKGVHAYADKMQVFSLLPDGAHVTDLSLHPVVQFLDFAKKHHQGIEGQSQATFNVHLPEDMGAPLEQLRYDISYIACTAKFCLPPKNLTVSIPIKLISSSSTISLQSQLDKNIFWTYLLVFFFGILASLTPCIYPLIPITLTIIGARSAGRKRRTSFLLSLTYVHGIAFTYSILGMVAAKTGSLFGQSLSHPLIDVGFCLFFIIMALGMFGFFEIRLPHFLAAKLTARGNETEGFISVFITGLIAGIIASPCIGPMLVSILAFIAKSQNLFLGFTLLFTFAMGMGLLLILIGTFSSFVQALPKSGGWMTLVKNTLGFLLLFVALYYGQLAYNEFKPHAPEKHYQHGWIGYSEEALNKARKENKPVLIDFYADWCAACVELDHKTFPNEKVIEKGKDFILLRVDATKTFEGLNELQKKYNVFGLPTVVCVNSKGEFIQDLSLLGYEAPSAFVQRMDQCSKR